MKQEAGLCECKLSADAGKKTVSAYGQESPEGTPVDMKAKADSGRSRKRFQNNSDRKDVRQWDCLTKMTGR